MSKIILYSAGLKGTVCNNLIYIHSFMLCFFLRAMNLLIFLVVNKIFYLLCILIFLRDKHGQVCYKRISVVIWKKYIWQGEIDCPLHTNVFFFYRYNLKSWYWSLLSNSFFFLINDATQISIYNQWFVYYSVKFYDFVCIWKKTQKLLIFYISKLHVLLNISKVSQTSLGWYELFS